MTNWRPCSIGAWAAGVGRILAVGRTPEGNRAAAVLAAGTRPASRRLSGSIARWRARRGPGELETLAALGSGAIGEIGLDYHYQPNRPPSKKPCWRMRC